MTDITLPDDLAAQLEAIAQRENRSPQAVIETLLARYIAAQPSPVEADPAVQTALRQMRPRLYALARAYWQRVADTPRLSLSDAELDDQFWLIDSDGIPRLKADQGRVELPPDPLVKIAETAYQTNWRTGPDDIAEDFDAVLAVYRSQANLF
jgi:hypothetical protein